MEDKFKLSANMILNDLMNEYGNLHIHIAAFLFVSLITNQIDKRVGLFPEYYEATEWLSNMKIYYLNKYPSINWASYLDGSLF